MPDHAYGKNMKVFKKDVLLDTFARFEALDITGPVTDAVRDSGISEGFALVSTPHATAAIRVNENEQRLQQDMERFLRDLADPQMPYRHDCDTVDGRPNAWGHLMALLMSSSAAIPVCDCALESGPWQSVFFVELDGPRQGRKGLVRVYGS